MVVNLAEWRGHILERIAQQLLLTADTDLIALLEELRGYPGPTTATPPEANGVALPFRQRVPGVGELSFLTTTTVFGAPVDVTLSEIFVEALLPADAQTAATLRRMAEGISPP